MLKPKNRQYRKNIAFTLAEVLITLGIIGVVAALTIPTLIKNYQNQETVTKLKKAYTTFNQAMAQMTLDAGTPNDLDGANLSEAEFNSEIVKYFKITKDCGLNAAAICMANPGYLSNIDGTPVNSYSVYNTNYYYRFITADGMALALDYSPCSDGTSRHISNDLNRTCGYVYIDLDGPDKGPKSNGRDFFTFRITNGHGAKLYPYGGADDPGYWKPLNRCSLSGDKTGMYCAGRIMDEGWQINY